MNAILLALLALAACLALAASADAHLGTYSDCTKPTVGPVTAPLRLGVGAGTGSDLGPPLVVDYHLHLCVGQ